MLARPASASPRLAAGTLRAHGPSKELWKGTGYFNLVRHAIVAQLVQPVSRAPPPTTLTRRCEAHVVPMVLPCRPWAHPQVYLLLPGSWIPLSSDGSDAWGLGWMGTWLPPQAQDTNAATPAASHVTDPMLYAAYTHLATSSGWRTDNSTVDRSSGAGLPPGQYIHVDPTWDAVFPFPDDITTSMFPMVRVCACDPACRRQSDWGRSQPVCAGRGGLR